MNPEKDSKKRSNTDWDTMEPLWLAGVISVLQLSKDFGVSRAAIIKHWDKLGIGRDLKGKIQAATDALVAKAEVTAVRLQHQVTPGSSKITDAETVATNAAMQANAILHQRKDVQRFRGLANSLLDELEVMTNDKELFAKLGEMLQAPDDKGVDKTNDLYRKVIGIAGRVDNTKKLAETLKILIGLEREVLGIEDKPKAPEGEISALLASLGQRSAFPVVK